MFRDVFRLLFNNTYKASSCLERPDFQLLDENKSQLHRQTEINISVSMLCVLSHNSNSASCIKVYISAFRLSLLFLMMHLRSIVGTRSLWFLHRTG